MTGRSQREARDVRRRRLPVPERRAFPTRMSSSTRGFPEDDDRAMTTRRRRRVSDCFARCDSLTVRVATNLTHPSVLHVQDLVRVGGRMSSGGRASRFQRGTATGRVTDCGSALLRFAWPAGSLPREWWAPPRFAQFALHAPVVCFAWRRDAGCISCSSSAVGKRPLWRVPVGGTSRNDLGFGRCGATGSRPLRDRRLRRSTPRRLDQIPDPLAGCVATRSAEPVAVVGVRRQAAPRGFARVDGRCLHGAGLAS